MTKLKKYSYVALNGKRIRCWVPDKAKGGKRWISSIKGRPFKDSREAHNYAVRHRELQLEVEAGPPRLTLKEAVDRCLTEKAAKIRAATMDSYRARLDPFVDKIGPKMPLHRLGRDDVKRYLIDRDKACSSVWNDWRPIKVFLKWCYSEDWIEKDLTKGMTKILPPERDQDREERQAFLAPERVLEIIAEVEATGREAAPTFADLMRLFYGTGLRRSGVANIKVEDVDLKAKRLKTVDKGKKVDIFLDAPELFAAVERLLIKAKEDGSETLVGRTAIGLDQAFKRWQVILNLPALQMHALKRAWVTYHNERVNSPKGLQRITRHSSEAMAMLYPRTQDADIREAVTPMFEASH